MANITSDIETLGASGPTSGLAERVARAATVLEVHETVDYARHLLVEALPIEWCEVSQVPVGISGASGRQLPLVAHGQPVGVLSLFHGGEVEFSAEQEAVLETVAAILALVLRESEPDAVAADRARIAHDLHDSVGQVLTGMGLRLAEHLTGAPDETWRLRVLELLDLTERASSELRESIHGLLDFEQRHEGLVESIGELCRDLERATGVDAVFRVHGTPVQVSAATHDTLFRVALEALKNIERHAKASTVIVELSYSEAAVSLRVHDDGVGLTRRDIFERRGHFGLRTIRRRIEDEGGHLYVGQARPHGVAVEVVIPDRERTAYAARTSGSRG
jgi:two-component system NarL family sensor kinase